MKHSTRFNPINLFFFLTALLLVCPIAGVQAQKTDDAGYAIDPLVELLGQWGSDMISPGTVVGTTTPTVAVITATAGPGGDIVPVGTVSVTIGDDQVFTISPDTDNFYEIDDILVDGDSVLDDDELELGNDLADEATYTFTNVQEDHTIEAQFALKKYTITATAGEGGSITPSGEVFVSHGHNQSFTISPDPGYAYVELLIDGSPNPIGPVTTYTFINVTADHSIEAQFVRVKYVIEASAGIGGSITPSGNVEVILGDDQDFLIEPDAGFRIKDVLVDDDSVLNDLDFDDGDATYTFVNVKANHTIEAQFEIKTFTITAAAGAGGSITPSGTLEVDFGDDQAFLIEADENYRIKDVLVDGASVDEVGLYTYLYTFEDIQDNHTIEAQFEQETHIIAATAGEGGAISPAGDVVVPHGTDQLFVITPDEGYHIDDVMVDETSIGATASYFFVNVTKNHSIHADFAINTYTLIYIAGDNGSLTGETEQTVEHGQDGTPVEAHPYEGYHFVQWSDGLTDNPRTDTGVTADLEVTAEFAINTYTLIYKAGNNGSLTGETEQTVEHGQDGTPVEAQADEGYHFVQWSDGLTDNPRTDTEVMDDLDVTAEFAIDTYTITATTGSNGTIEPKGAVTVTHGSSQTFEIIPDYGYRVSELLIDGDPVEPATSYTFVNVTGDHSIHVEFALKTYTIQASASAGGSIDPEGDVAVVHGHNQVFTFTPDEGYVVENVLIDDITIGAVNAYTFVNVTSDHRIHAQFGPITYTITFEVADTEGEPIDDAVISINGETADAGEYVFALVPGIYQYVVSREGYFDATGEVELTDQDVTETVELTTDDTPVYDAEEHILKVYPNPATDRVTVESGLLIHRISMIDMLGQVVYEENVGGKQHEISVSGLIEGLYFLRIDTDKGVKTHRIQLIK